MLARRILALVAQLRFKHAAIVATLRAVDHETNLENRAIRSGRRESVLLALDV